MLLSISHFTVACCCVRIGAGGVGDKKTSRFLSSSSASPEVTKGRYRMETPMEKKKDFTDRLVGLEGVVLSVPNQPVCQNMGNINGAKEIFFFC